ncbi:MAG: HEAT repeat domain-containing protein, partial [Thermoguttaceae bacterium]|nr:HEAT repeat domain-containing protein [Thermoguttaceae bacterium]
MCQALLSGDPALESMALRLVPEVAGPAAAERLAACLPKAPPAVQGRLVGALAIRPDSASARGAIEAAASGADAAVRLAALGALGTCGGEPALATLLDRVLSGPPAESEVARDSLARVRGAQVSGRLAELLARGSARAKVEILRILAQRNAHDVVAAIQTTAEDPDSTVRSEAWKALAALARPEDGARLVELAIRARDGERDEAEKAVVAALRRQDRPDVRPVLERLDAAKSPAAQASLVRILGAVGDDRGLDALRKAAASGDATVRDAAVRGLAAWPAPSALEDLVGLARQAKDP